MTFDPTTFLSLAKNLFSDGNYGEEEKYRTCISRSYYAAHLFTREKLKRLELINQKELNEKREIYTKK